MSSLRCGIVASHVTASIRDIQRTEQEFDQCMLQFLNGGEPQVGYKLHLLWLKLQEWDILNLPVDILEYIFTFVSSKDHTSLRLSCKLFRDLTNIRPLNVFGSSLSDIHSVNVENLSPGMYSVLHLYGWYMPQMDKILNKIRATTIVVERYNEKLLDAIWRYRHCFERFILIDDYTKQGIKVNLPWSGCVTGVLYTRKQFSKQFTRMFA